MQKTPIILAAAGLLGVQSTFATFIVDTDPGGVALNLVQDQNVSSFQGDVAGNLIDVTAVGNVDVAHGNATIKPTNKNTTLTTLVFTPADPNLFSDFSFRGQLEDAAGGVVTLVVQDNQGNPAQTFTFSGLGANANFQRVGIISQDGETIQSVTLRSNFKEQKQTEFSFAGGFAVPDGCSTLLLLGVGLTALAQLRRRV